jgi:hypothetical protein
MNSPLELTGPVNLGNPREFTVRQLAEMVIRLTGSRSKIEFRPLPTDDPNSASLTSLRRERLWIGRQGPRWKKASRPPSVTSESCWKRPNPLQRH